MATQDELLSALRSRYERSSRLEKGRVVTEVVALTVYHRKHGARLLRSTAAANHARPRAHHRRGDDAVREALIVLWAASDRICANG